MSWATVAEADLYLAAKVGAESWAGLTADAKTRALTTAYRRLLYDPMYIYPAMPTDRMKYAQIELACALTSNGTAETALAMQAAGVESFRIGSYYETYRSDADVVGERQSYPQIVVDLLEPYRARLSVICHVERREES
jgi:hypothetical protein